MSNFNILNQGIDGDVIEHHDIVTMQLISERTISERTISPVLFVRYLDGTTETYKGEEDIVTFIEKLNEYKKAKDTIQPFIDFLWDRGLISDAEIITDCMNVHIEEKYPKIQKPK